MPSGDGTGPGGMGPMTGRAAGYCAGYTTPGFANPVGGRGGGFGFGFGARRGRRNWFGATGMPGWQRAQTGLPAWGGYAGSQPVPPQGVSPEQELEMLRGQTGYYENTLKNIQSRIEELEKKQNKE